MKPSARAEFHLIARGQCWLRLKSRKEPIPLLAGDVVVFPHGGDGIPADILCGYFEFDRAARHPLVTALPPLIHIRSADASDFAWLQSTVQLIAHETRAPRPGTDAVVNRLVEVLFIQVLRAYVERAGTPPGILAAVADKQIGAALALLHGAPEKPWSLAELGKHVAMSRSAFAARFAQLAGQPPMEYLAQRRMEKARELLRGEGLNAAAVAEKVGYRSEAAFSKAFKRIVGTGPGAFRRKGSTPAPLTQVNSGVEGAAIGTSRSRRAGSSRSARGQYRPS